MKKFKVGDRVKINHRSPYSLVGIQQPKGTVLSTYEPGNKGNRGTVLVEVDGYAVLGFQEDEIELISQPQSVVIYSDGTITTALLKEGKKTVKTAIAKCSPADTYDFETGARIAFDRLVKEDKPVQSLNIVKQDSYKTGDRVKIVDKWSIGCCQNAAGEMDKWLGKAMTVNFEAISGAYRMLEDGMENSGCGWIWKTEAIKGKVMEPVREVKRPAKVGEYIKVVSIIASTGKAYKKGDICEVIEASDGDATGGVYAKTRGTHPCNAGENTSYLYQSEYVVLENYNPKG